MPFANIKVPQAALSKAQKEEIVHRVTNMFVEYFSEAARPHTMVLIEEVPDGGYGRADEVFVIPARTGQKTSAGNGWALDAAGARYTDTNGHIERKATVSCRSAFGPLRSFRGGR